MRLGSVGERLARVEAAAVEAVEELRGRGVRAAIIGGLAVIEHGYARSTADVDLLVVESSRVTGTPLGIPGVSLPGWDVPVDVLFIDARAPFLRASVFEATDKSPPVIGLAPLVYLKLSASRAKDFADVVELLKVDLPGREEEVRRWLAAHAPHLVSKFYRAVDTARRELAEQR